MTGNLGISRTGWLGVIIVAAVGAAVAIESPPMPTTKSTGRRSWDNVLETAYVGNAECARCHAEQSTHHEKTGHAHTLFTDNLCEQFSSLVGRDLPDPERKGSFRFDCQNGELSSRYRGDEGDATLPVHFAFGSGKHAVTFLTLILGNDGEPAAIEHRLSLLNRGTETALTPSQAGLPIATPLDCLGRLKRGRDVTTCIGCHSTTGQVRGTRVDDLRLNVGCESCHGPGRRHVAAMEAGRGSHEISFGKGRASADEELHLCGRCHRSTDALSVLPDPDEPKLARFQPVGVSQSACFRRSDGAFKCSTCHDPHQSVDHTATIVNTRCQSCHDGAVSGRTVCSVASTGNCAECHMPAVEVHPGISFHDHWIRKRKRSDP